MGLAGALLLGGSAALLALALRALLGAPSKAALICGWIGMAGFAALAAYCFWQARALRTNPDAAGAVVAAQKFMVLYLAGLLMAAYAVGKQKRTLAQRKPTAPVPSTSGPPAP